MEIKPHLCDEYSTVSPAYGAVEPKRWHKSEYTTERFCRDILLLWWLSYCWVGKEEKSFSVPGQIGNFVQLEYFYGLHNFFALTIKSRVVVHNTFATKRFSIAKQSRRTNIFLSFSRHHFHSNSSWHRKNVFHKIEMDLCAPFDQIDSPRETGKRKKDEEADNKNV